MTDDGLSPAEAWRDLLGSLTELDEHFVSGERAVVDEKTRTEGYRFLASVLGVALDVFVFADPGRPRFVDINAPDRPDRCWGGDNTDASYQFCAVDPARTYRVSGTQGDSAYFSVTVYNLPGPGRWSNRVAGIVNDADLEIRNDGSFEFYVGPERPAGWSGAFVELDDDTVHLVTRDYQAVYDHTTRTRFEIEALDPPTEPDLSGEALARGLASVKAWVAEQFVIVPMAVTGRGDDEFTEGHNSPTGANEIAQPYQILDSNYGWSARDACYAFGTFDLRPDEALVVTHRSPNCRFWNLNLWNPFMAKFAHDYGRVSINGSTAVPNADGSVTAVISGVTDHAHPNAITTLGHRQGMIAYRWFLADEVPERPACEVVPIGRAPTTTS